MASLNKVQIIGHLGRDPETRYTPDGAAITNVSIATTSAWKDKQSNEKKEETEWHRVTFFNRLAEVAGEYLTKGSMCYVEGRLKTRKYTDKEGVEKYATDIIAERLQMLSKRGEGESGGGGGRDSGRDAAPAARPAAGQAGRDAVSDFDDSDIPFANPYRGKYALLV